MRSQWQKSDSKLMPHDTSGASICQIVVINLTRIFLSSITISQRLTTPAVGERKLQTFHSRDFSLVQETNGDWNFPDQVPTGTGSWGNSAFIPRGNHRGTYIGCSAILTTVSAQVV